MNETVVEVLKALGYPLGSVLTLVVLAYLARQFFQKLLEFVVARDLEAIKAQNVQNLEEIKEEHNLVLESRKAELVQETERLKTVLSVEAETHRLAAQKRFDVLLDLWQSSESLLQTTDFRETESIQMSLSQVDTSLVHLRKCSVLLSPELLDAVRAYLEETVKVLTTSEEELQKRSVDPDKEKRISQLVSSVFSVAVPVPIVALWVGAPLAGVLSGLIVPSIEKTLEKLRYKRAEKARAKLEEVIRKEFGVQGTPVRALLATGTEEGA